MFVAVPLGVVGIFQCLLHFDIKGAPVVVQMIQDLEGGDIAVCCEEMFQLGITMFVKGIT
jgi:hypothetical protein